MHLLVVDDDPGNRNLYKRAFRGRSDVTIDEACDGLAGLFRATAHMPDLILTDWEMPRKTGPEMVTEIALAARIALKAMPPVMILTGKDFADPHGIQAELEAIIPPNLSYVLMEKPFKMEVLMTALEFVGRMRGLSGQYRLIIFGTVASRT